MGRTNLEIPTHRNALLSVRCSASPLTSQVQRDAADVPLPAPSGASPTHYTLPYPLRWLLPHAPFLGSSEVPRYTAHLPDTPYLGQGSDYRTFHYASKEDQVQFRSPSGIGQGSQVVQDLLHSWGRGDETLSTSWAQKTKIQHRPCPPSLRKSPNSTLFSPLINTLALACLSH